MQTRERRSCAPLNPGRLSRKRWTRPDVARPEPVTRLDVLAELPHAGRKDVMTASLAGNGAVTL